MAILSPTLDECQQLDPSLNHGEDRVAAALASLDDGWTVYVQPRLGQDMPDFIALHDRFGVCAIEVKNWSRGTYRQADDGSIEYVTGEGVWHRSDDQPRYQAYRYRSTIFDQYFALPDDNPSPTTAVRSVVILPQYSSEDAQRLLERVHVTTDEHSVRVIGGDALLSTQLEDALRGTGCTAPRSASMNRLRQHLAEADVMREQRRPARLSADAGNIATNPSNAARRRVRGPAGCGKSFGLAARAARLAADGKTVLVLTYNVTLSHYLQSMAGARCRDNGADPALITTVNFHGFCRRIADDARLRGWLPLDCLEGMRNDQLVELAQAAFERGFPCRYDAVLIDEGQDFTLEWWNMLRQHVAADDGEMLLVADPTQDVYGNRSWTDEAKMLGAGFSGPWTELRGSYRLPTDLVPIANQFAAKYLSGEQLAGAVPVDRAEISGLSGVTRRSWVNIDRPDELGRAMGAEVVRLLAANPTLAPGDVVFLCETHEQGLAAVRVVEGAGHPVQHIFSNDERARGYRKRRFWPDAPGVKGCTVHSFKGWETRALVMGVGMGNESRRLAYVAMTRVKSDSAGGESFLSIVNSDLKIAGFQSSFEEWAAPSAEMRRC